jgi:DNA processing protein
MSEQLIEACLTLSKVSGIGPKAFQSLVQHFGSVNHVLAAAKGASNDELLAAGINNRTVNNLRKASSEGIQKDLDWFSSSDQHHILTLDDPAYPRLLKQTPAAPPLLFVNGHLDILNDPQLAMVGSRNPTQNGRDLAYQFAKYLGSSGFCINSGLALGIDGFSHKGALDAPAPTIAVIATGVDRVYPAQHRALAHQIVEQGAIVSEFFIGTEPRAQNFPRRNRIISGLSLGVLVVEAAVKSGSLITARHALEQDREVFAIPGSIHNPLARGCHQLIRQGAKLVETAEHILEEIANSLEFQLKLPDIAQQEMTEKEKSSSPEWDEDYQNVLNAMGFEPISIDAVIVQTGLTAEEVSSILLMLELQGHITSSGGGSYTRLSSRG